MTHSGNLTQEVVTESTIDQVKIGKVRQPNTDVSHAAKHHKNKWRPPSTDYGTIESRSRVHRCIGDLTQNSRSANSRNERAYDPELFLTPDELSSPGSAPSPVPPPSFPAFPRHPVAETRTPNVRGPGPRSFSSIWILRLAFRFGVDL